MRENSLINIASASITLFTVDAHTFRDTNIKGHNQETDQTTQMVSFSQFVKTPHHSTCEMEQIPKVQ